MYFHKLIHDCHCHLETRSIYVRPNFLLLRWDCCEMGKCRSEGVNNTRHGDIRVLSVYCVLLLYPLTAHGALTDPLTVPWQQLEMSEQSNYLSFALTQRASQQPRFIPAVRAQWPHVHCLWGPCTLLALWYGKCLLPVSRWEWSQGPHCTVEYLSVFGTFDVFILRKYWT